MRKIIYLTKKEVIKNILIYTLIILFFVYLLLYHTESLISRNSSRNIEFNKILLAIIIVMLIPNYVSTFLKLFNKNPELIIYDDGLQLNKYKFLPFSDISLVTYDNRTEEIVILLHSFDKFVSQQSLFVKLTFLNSRDELRFGSDLDIDSKELFNIILKKFLNYTDQK